MPEQRIFLGECEYYGHQAKAYREVYSDCWKFVIETSPKERNVLATY